MRQLEFRPQLLSLCLLLPGCASQIAAPRTAGTLEVTAPLIGTWTDALTVQTMEFQGFGRYVLTTQADTETKVTETGGYTFDGSQLTLKAEDVVSVDSKHKRKLTPSTTTRPAKIDAAGDLIIDDDGHPVRWHRSK